MSPLANASAAQRGYGKGRCKSLATFASIAWKDLGTAAETRSNALPSEHLLAAERWLCHAQDVSGDGGVSYGYTLTDGWRPSYPETSGYIAATFFRLARQRDRAYFDRACRIVRWLLSVQNADGSFSNPRYGNDGIVFDTGQVLFGLICAFEATGDSVYLDGARRAATWLAQIAGTDLRWTRNEHLSTPHVYNTRTCWALLRLNAIEYDARREAVARANLDWAVAEQSACGLFAHCSFRKGEAPFTHTLAYTARGLLESAELLREKQYTNAAQQCADAVLGLLSVEGHLPSRITTSGVANASSSCLTGNCQFAIVWLRLALLIDRPHYRPAAARALEFVMRTQDLLTEDMDVRGAIKGSQPIWGVYAPMSLPNWATKFFVDAMWLLGESRA
ncbi:MAG: hypothetical protein H7274_05785 [Rhodoferax sp.]|nr:hypothetical protein [Rhodoferax sp.]